MRRLCGVVLAMVLVCGLNGRVRADDTKDVNAIVDKAIKAVGGEEALTKIKAASWKSKGTITFMGTDNNITTMSYMQDLTHFRLELDGEFGGNKFKGVTILAGDKGSRTFAENHTDLDKDALVNQKRTVYLAVIPMTLLPLKGKDFKAEVIPDLTVADKPSAGIKVTAPDGKTFKLYFDKETGLPSRLVATVIGFGNDEFTQETTFSAYKEMAGVKVATKISSKHNGEKFIEEEITDFKLIDNIDPKLFTDV